MRENFIACITGYGLMKGALIVYLLLLLLEVIMGVNYQALLYGTSKETVSQQTALENG